MTQREQEFPPLHLEWGHRPKVLLLGNGLNRVYGGASWANLLAKINRTKFTAEQVKSMPFPMQAVLLSDDHVDISLMDLRRELSRCELHDWERRQLGLLLEMDFDCILTTNFTYELECAAVPDFLKNDHYRRGFLRHTGAVARAELNFMLHTYYELPLKRGPTPLFHIHGEAKKTDSVILGHYYYGNLLCRCDEYLETRVRGNYLRCQRQGRGLNVLSWVDYFLLGDIYTLGCGLDTSEMDLWWLLCRKKREMASHGDMYFFEPKKRSAMTKVALLEAYQVKTISMGMVEPNDAEYQIFYQRAIREIGRRLIAGHK